MSLLEIEGLTHSFGENLLYKNAGFTLNKGEHIGIVGQNGTGTVSYTHLEPLYAGRDGNRGGQRHRRGR